MSAETALTSVDTGDRVAVAFSRAVTRRGFLQKTMRWTFALAAASSTSLVFPRFAAAISCKYGTWWPPNTSGCYCNNTPGCGSGNCNETSCVGTGGQRCTFWSGIGSPYCWCSKVCCLGVNQGYFSCCDCWRYQGSDCLHGTTACICAVRVLTGPC